MLNPSRPPRARLTLPIVGWAAVDIAGMVLLALGGAWFREGDIFIAGFPGSAAEAGASVLAGIAIMFWAATRILREVARQHEVRQPTDAS